MRPANARWKQAIWLGIVCLVASATCTSADPYSQNFNTWTNTPFETFGTYTNDGWVLHQGDVETGAGFLYRVVGTNYPYLMSPPLTNGAGAVTWKASKYAGNAVIFHLQKLSNSVWVTLYSFTNNSGSAITYNKDVNENGETKIRLLKTGGTGGSDFMYMDDVAISLPPSYVQISGVTLTPDPQRSGQSVAVTATIVPFSGASNIDADLYYRARSGDTFTAIPMNPVGGNAYRTAGSGIPAQVAGVLVEYYIQVSFYDPITAGTLMGYYPKKAPSTVETYRPIPLSLYDGMDVVGTQGTNMLLVGDYQWQGVITPSGPLNNPNFQFSSGATTWGDADQTVSNLPAYGTADLAAGSITVSGTITNHLAFLFSPTNEMDYSIQHCAYGDMESWSGSSYNSGYTNNGWVMNGAMVSTASDDDTSRAFRGKFLLLKYGTGGGNQYLRSPEMSDGVGTVSFWYRHRDDASSPAAAFVVEKSETGSGDWAVLDTVTNIQSMGYVYYSQAVGNRNVHYVRIRNLDVPSQPDSWLCVDDVIVTAPGATVELGNPWRNTDFPPIGVGVDVSVDITDVDGGATNLACDVVVRHASNTLWSSVSLTLSNSTFYGSIPPGPAGAMFYYFRCTYDGFGAAPAFYPEDGVTSPDLLSYTNLSTLPSYRIQNFDSWSTPDTFGIYTNNGWVLHYGAVDANEGYLSKLGNSPVYLISPMLSNGAGRIYFKAKNFSATPTVMSIQSSTNGVHWVTAAIGTNTTTTYTDHSYEINVYDDVHVRILKTTGAGATDFLLLDNVEISFPPADVAISDIGYMPGYPASNQSVSVSCAVDSLNPHSPAFGIAPTIYHRLGAGSWSTTPMSQVSSNTYAGTVPPYPPGIVSYFVRTDFAGYYNVRGTVSENQSPAFSPEAPQTQTQPATFHAYNVRNYQSDYGYLTATVGDTTNEMFMVGNDVWQGVIDPGDTNQFLISLSGFLQWTGLDYSSATSHWGSAGDVRDTLPIIGVGLPDGTNFLVTGDFAGQIIIRYDITDNSFVILEGYFQNFDEWRASRDYFEESLGNTEVELFENNFDNWTVNNLYVTQPGNDREDFEYWPTNRYTGIMSNNWPAGWFIELAGTTSEMVNASMACALHQNGSTWPFRSKVTKGLKQFDFKYRVTQNIFDPTIYLNGTLWPGYRVKADLRASQLSPMKPYLSLFSRYQTSSTYYEARFRRINDTQIDITMWRHKLGSSTRLGWVPTRTTSLTTSGLCEFTVIPNNAGRVFLEASYDGSRVYSYDTVGNQITGAGTIGINTFDAYIIADNVQVADVDVQRFENWSEGSFSSYTEPYTGWKITAGRPTGDYCLLQRNGTTQSPHLGYQIGDVRFSYRKFSGTDSLSKIRVDSSPDGLAWTLGIYSDASFGTGNKNATIPDASINNSHRYLRWVNNSTEVASELRIEDIYLQSSTNFYAQSFTSGAPNWSNVNGNWNWHSTGKTWRRPGYVGPGVNFDVEITSTNNSRPTYPFHPYTDTYSNLASVVAANNLSYISTQIVVKTWEDSYVRIKQTSSAGHVVVDDLTFTSWRATNNTTKSGWQLREGWIGSDSPGNRLELWRSRAAPYEDQYLRTPWMSNSVGDLKFEYKTINGPATFVVEGTTAKDSEVYTIPLGTVTNDSPGEWARYELTLNTNRAMHLRVRHVSPDNDTILLIDRASVTDYAAADSNMWASYNTRITYNLDDLEFQPYETPEEDFKTCFLNNSPTDGTYVPLSDSLPFLQSPYLRRGIGEISFWHKPWEEDGDPPGKLYLYWTPQTPADSATEWHHLATLNNIDQPLYKYFTTNYYVRDARHLRIYAETNNASRVAMDNVLITQPVGAGFEVDYLRIIPEIPLDADEVLFETRLSNFFLDPTNIICRVYYHIGSNEWASWSKDNSVPLVEVSRGPSTRIYRTTAGNGISASLTDIDDVVQYVLRCTYDGQFAEQASPLDFQAFSNPSHYAPIDLNAASATKNGYYFVYSSYPGDVWINEVNYKKKSTEGALEYVELAGFAGTDIGKWRIDLVTPTLSRYGHGDIPQGTSLPNDTNGFGFFVYGDPTVANVDMAFTNPTSQNLVQDGGLRLVRSMGAYEQRVCYGANVPQLISAGYEHIGTKNTTWASALFLTGAGSNVTDFTWSYQNPGFFDLYYSPGEANLNQEFLNAVPPAAEIVITDLLQDASNVWVVFTIDNATGPTPWYATNLLDANPWYAITPYYESSSGNLYTQRFDRMTSSPVYYFKIKGTEDL